MKKQASYNPGNNKTTYGQNIHHGEVKFGSKVINDSPGAFGQKLAASKGTTGAKNLLKSRYSKSA